MKLEVGIFKDPQKIEITNAWEVILEQEKTPHKITEQPDCPIIVCDRIVPDWLPEFMNNGGICIVTEANQNLLPFKTNFIGHAFVEYIDLTQMDSERTRISCSANIFKGDGLGIINIHENRITKSGIIQDQYPVFLYKQFGKGGCYYSGIPFSKLITGLGDTLRVCPYFSKFTERIVSVDKHNIIRSLRFILIRAFNQIGLPYVHVWYYPKKYNSAFTFRIDVDGVFGENLINISNSALKNQIILSFFINKSMCEKDQNYLFRISDRHEIGNHADIHNLYSDYTSNYQNINECKMWLDQLGIKNGPWFAAPRGMWNHNLHQALNDLNYIFTSDFGCAVSGYPFFPYIAGRRMKTLQIPVHPFSTERGEIWLKESSKVSMGSKCAINSFINIIRSCYRQNYPIMLYSHPKILGTMADEVFSNITIELHNKNIWNTTLAEFAEWWILRDKFNFSANFEPNIKKLSIEADINNNFSINKIFN